MSLHGSVQLGICLAAWLALDAESLGRGADSWRCEPPVQPCSTHRGCLSGQHAIPLFMWLPPVTGVPVDEAWRAEQCAVFGSVERLRLNEPFEKPLFDEFEFRLVPERDEGWHIIVNPIADRTIDYVWPVSPPYQTAPQLKVGPGYGRTAVESVRLKRDLRFVVNADDYQRAFDTVSRRPVDADEVHEMLEQLATGTLRIEFTGFGTRRVVTADGRRLTTLDWITFTGEACRP